MLGAKLRLYGAIGWGLLIAFAFLGALMNKPAAPYILVITVVMWGSIRIVSEASASVKVLRMISTMEKAAKENPSEEPDDRDA